MEPRYIWSERAEIRLLMDIICWSIIAYEKDSPSYFFREEESASLLFPRNRPSMDAILFRLEESASLATKQLS